MGDNVNSVWAKHKELKQHIIKMEGQVEKKTLQTRDIYQPMMDYSKKSITALKGVGMLGLSELKQYQMDKINKEELGNLEEHAQLKEDIFKQNEESKKKSIREKEATARLGEGHKYFSQSSQELLAARERIATDVREDRVDRLRVPFTGDEFALDPQTGGMLLSMEVLLRKRAEFAKHIRLRHSENESPNLSSDIKLKEQLFEEVNLDILQHLDEAIQLLYQANGIDEKTGKRVGSIKKKQAQKQFALAMEAYRDSVKKAEENEIKKIISRVENSNIFKNHLKDVEKGSDASHMEESKESAEQNEIANQGAIMFGSKLKLGAKERDAVIEMRDMIRNNKEDYMVHQDIVDKLYQEALQYSTELTRVQNRKLSMAFAILHIYGRDNMVGYVGKAYHMLARENNEELALRNWTSHIIMAMSYYLENKQPKTFADRLFLFEHCGVSLGGMEDISARSQRIVQLQTEGRTEEEVKAIMYDERKRALIDRWRAEGKTDEQIADMMYAEEQTERSLQAEENVRTELEQRKARIRQEGGNPDADEEVQQKEKLLWVLSKSNLEQIADREVLFSDQSAVEHYISKQDLYHKIFVDPQDNAAKRRIIGEDGKEKWINRYKVSGTTRDIFSNISSIENPGDCGMEKAYHYLDNIVIISRQEKSVVAEEEYEKAQAEIDQLIQSGEIKSEEREVRLEERKKERYEERLTQALEEEVVMERQEKERIETYIQEKNLRGIPEWPTMEELVRYRKLTRPLFEKIQGLSYRMNAVMGGTYFEQLPVQMQKEVLELHAFYQGVEELATCVLNLYTNRAQGLPSEPLKSIEQYIDEKREADRGVLRRKAAQASAAQENS
ncbi:MAG: hypothetical protein PUK75_07170 [bacterium]|nr:hypothetical protein [bacterium]MDY4099579.1 hypothetical protein [Lachnospiraceae bacterium]